MTPPVDGFWLPREVREIAMGPDTHFQALSFKDGRPCEEGEAGAVSARWPQLSAAAWRRTLEILNDNRRRAPRGDAFWGRLSAALEVVGRRFASPGDPIRKTALESLPGYSGYSEAMIRLTLEGLDLMSLEGMAARFRGTIPKEAARGWVSIEGLPGRLRFYAKGGWLGKLGGLGRGSLFGELEAPGIIVGYGAGNVPGAALLIVLLGLATTLSGEAPPVMVIKNSRREPIFSPLVLSALAEADPELVSTVAVSIWDYEETDIQETLIGEADLVVAAASDETIGQIRSQIAAADRRLSRPPTRFHAHGHKVSFSAIGAETLVQGLADPTSGRPLIEIAALLAGLDSVFWDQHGCLSSRIHFVERGDGACHTPMEYAQQLEAQLRLLAAHLPRGAWPLSQIHDRFDRYKSLESTGQVKVLSGYDDEFLVAFDQRPLDAPALSRAVNDCQGRAILVRPVDDLMEVPGKFLRSLPSANLQSLSVATGEPGGGLTERILKFGEACGRCGVTAMRSVGRGAFPQLAYSWDGLIPMDLVRRRAEGYFTSIEFDSPYEQILDTYHKFQGRGN